MRVACLIPFVLVALALPVAPAVAKEGVHAELEGKVRLGAAPGTRLRVTWRLVDEQGHAFGAGGIYLRMRRCSGSSRRVDARDLGGGRFTARLTVPKGRIRRLRVGLEGWRMTPGSEMQRADVFFPFDPPLVRRCG